MSKVLVTIFGATGDLAKRKLYPSLYRLYKSGILEEDFAVIGTARRPWTKEMYEEVVLDSISDLIENTEDARTFASHFYYQAHDVNDSENYVTLKNLSLELGQKYQTENNKIFFLAMAPEFFGTIAGHLKSENITDGLGYERLIIEKPFGTSLKSAEKLNDELSMAFSENQIFRIDHYLGKEMIQNIFAIRFANFIFDKIWNRNFIDNIQITFAEAIGVEDRGAYYDKSGALKDMVQNHILQVLSLLAMDKPASFKSSDILKEKIKVLENLELPSTDEIKDNFVRGQYHAGHFEGHDYLGYRQENAVDPQSMTETFAAGTIFVNNERFKDVPFFFRTGKRMTEKGTRINIVFKKEDSIFSSKKELKQNILTIYIQPTEGFSLLMNGKEVGKDFNINDIKLDFRHDAAILGNSPEAYEKLIYDVLHGDSSNFSRWEEVKASWILIDDIERVWSDNQVPLYPYEAGSMGPKESFRLLEEHHASWIWQPDLWYKEHSKD
ncbi:glucose-6-phosphate dehydrogenase [Streptococcaceae bacterium ESL0729]|nr:glucose-6-phosphate dehydrogenase [Streptococcaceae bacterium ESL0729]